MCGWPRATIAALKALNHWLDLRLDDEACITMEGLFALSFAAEDHLPQLAALARRYADRQPDLADLCLVRMSELKPDTTYVSGV